MSANSREVKGANYQSRRLDTITGFGKWTHQPQRPEQPPPPPTAQDISFLYPSQFGTIAAVNKT
jgi:hypothetical protein